MGACRSSMHARWGEEVPLESGRRLPKSAALLDHQAQDPPHLILVGNGQGEWLRSNHVCPKAISGDTRAETNNIASEVGSMQRTNIQIFNIRYLDDER